MTIGRFMSIDPLTEEYNTWSPYVFSGNRVIDARELEGLEPYFPYKSKDAASENFSQNYNGISIVNDREFATKVYSTGDAGGNTIYSYAEPIEGGPAGVNPNKVVIPSGTNEEAMAHTHGAYGSLYDNDNFSGVAGDAESRGDMGVAERKNLDVYVATPNGSFQKYDVKTDKITLLSTAMPSDPKHPSRLNKKDAIVPVTTITPKPVEIKPIEIKSSKIKSN